MELLFHIAESMRIATRGTMAKPFMAQHERLPRRRSVQIPGAGQSAPAFPLAKCPRVLSRNAV